MSFIKNRISAESLEEKYAELNRIIQECDHIVFFGGAGVSTESGIPDFRSKDGLYNQHDVQFDRFSPEYLLSNDCLYRQSKVFFEFYRQKMNVEGIEPNAAHKKLAEMEAKGKLDGVITQNIDGLHQKAGSVNVQEIHGTTLRNYCSVCRKEVSPDFIFKSMDPIPKCPYCGGMVRPDVTLYGEGLPNDAWMNSIRLLHNADCMIVGGTSLSVYPAASLIDDFAGRYLIIINRDLTNRDRSASLVFHESIGEVLSHIQL
ncbi:MAG TPA: NAD-dependent protein deacylase [Lachnospiraceae bacterium]|nr:NAD-dependent protein deacylase [Lachnospiraceae bacterium]